MSDRVVSAWGRMRSKLKQGIRLPFVWLIILYVLVGIVYAVATPVMEKPDEGGHYGYLLYLREQRTLPPPLPPSGVIWWYEFKQPPLYYVVATVLTGWLPDTPDLRQTTTLNPYMWESVPGYRNDNRNRYLHPPDMTPLFFGARLVSLMFGLGTVVASYFLTVQLFPKNTRVPIAVAAVVGFQPQFIYIATAINDDSAIAFWGALIMAFLIYRLKRGNWPFFAVLVGGLVGLAILTKVSGLIFFPLVGLALLLIHRGLNRAFFRDGFILVAVALLIGGWWYARNLLLYNDPLTLGAHNMLGAEPDQIISWKQFRHTLVSVEYTFWANQSRVFISPIGIDKALIAWGRISLGLLGLSLVLNRRSLRANLPVGIVLLSWPAIYWVLLVGYWNLKFPWSLGRLLFPALTPIALLLVMGWYFAFPPWWRRPVLTLSVGMMMVASSVIPFLSLYPLYHPSREWQADQVQRPVGTVYVDSTTGAQIARLIGYNLLKPYASPGELFPLELCWEPMGQTRVPYTMFVQLLDLSRLRVGDSPGVWGRRMTYPGLGSRSTDRWALHQAFCDTLLVQTFPETPTPLGAAIEVGFFDDVDQQSHLQAVDAEGEPIALPVIGGLPIISPEALAAKQTALYTFDNALALNRAQLAGEASGTITLTLTWQSLQPVSYDATTFAHLRQADGNMVAQVDREPLDGRFPTSYWLPGQIITDVISLSMPTTPPGEPLVLNVGMYQWPSMQRLAAQDASGRLINDVVVINVPAQ